MTQLHINRTIEAIKDRLDEVLAEYNCIDEIISKKMQSDPEFFGSLKYYEFQIKKTELGAEHTKLTDALVTLEKYMK